MYINKVIDMSIREIVEGSLMGDGTIKSTSEKYFTFQLVGKDIKFLEWAAKFLNMSGIDC